MITIKFNNENISLPLKATIINFLQEINNSGNGIAVAVNEIVITKSDWDKKQLKNNDNVLVIKATQGG